MNELNEQCNPYDPSASLKDGETSVANANRSISILGGFVGWAVMLGVVTAIWPNPNPIFSVALNVPFIVLLLNWCQNDAEGFGIRLGKWARLGLFFVFPVALCVHFFRTRGIRGFMAIFLAALFFVALIIVFGIALVATSVIMYGDLSRLQ